GLPQAAPIGLIQIPAFPRLEEEEEEEEEEGEGDEEETEEEETEETVSPVGEIQWQHALILGDILTVYRYLKQFPDEATLLRDYPKQPWVATQGLLVINALGQNKTLPVGYATDVLG